MCMTGSPGWFRYPEAAARKSPELAFSGTVRPGPYPSPFPSKRMSDQAVRHSKWSDIPLETVKEGITRRLFTGERMMFAHVYLEKGAVVPTHSHENEQLTYIVEGALHFWIGEGDSLHERVIREGEILFLPSNVPHKAVALEDTFDIDVFSPPRQDWLDGTDSYFHDED